MVNFRLHYIDVVCLPHPLYRVWFNHSLIAEFLTYDEAHQLASSRELELSNVISLRSYKAKSRNDKITGQIDMFKKFQRDARQRCRHNAKILSELILSTKPNKDGA